MAGHAVRHSIERAGIDPAEVDEVVMGCGTPQGTTGNNIGRLTAIKAGCPVTTTGVTVSRHCSSGLNAIATAAGRIIVDGEQIVVGAGVESITHSLGGKGFTLQVDKPLAAAYPGLWMPMIETADIVAERYKISREDQDEYALQSQQPHATPHRRRVFDDEIVPMKTTMAWSRTRRPRELRGRLHRRPRRVQPSGHHARGPREAEPVFKRGRRQSVTAGNASQLSDGASATCSWSARAPSSSGSSRSASSAASRWRAAARGDGHRSGLRGAEAAEAPRAHARRHRHRRAERGVRVAAALLPRQLGIDDDEAQSIGGSISIGHPFGMTGSRMTGQLLRELRRRKAKRGVVTMCIGGGQGAAGLFEIF